MYWPQAPTKAPSLVTTKTYAILFYSLSTPLPPLRLCAAVSGTDQGVVMDCCPLHPLSRDRYPPLFFAPFSPSAPRVKLPPGTAVVASTIDLAPASTAMTPVHPQHTLSREELPPCTNHSWYPGGSTQSYFRRNRPQMRAVHDCR